MAHSVSTAPCITLLTDFGERDGFAGVMRGVILGINPHARIVDLSHDIPPQDIDAAAWVLAASYAYFSDGTIHVIVVDPGVGSDRAILLAATARHVFLAPDNGVLTPVLRRERLLTIRQVTNSALFLPEISRTFHGRDIFAPVAAHLSLGVPPEQVGPVTKQYIKRSIPPPREVTNGLRGCVQYIDRFGNAITNIEKCHLDNEVKAWRIQAGSARIDGISETYAAAAAGQPMAVIGSAGFLEIAVANGNAANILGLSVGTPVMLTTES